MQRDRHAAVLTQCVCAARWGNSQFPLGTAQKPRYHTELGP